MGKRYYAKSANSDELLIDILSKGKIKVGKTDMDVHNHTNGFYEFVADGKSHKVVVVKRTEEYTRVMLNGKLCDVKTDSEGEKLIKQLGLDKVKKKRLKDLKAPMPGMVLKVLVEKGQRVAKGDGLLILEAMKMENLIKAGESAVIGSVNIKEAQAVEKGQLLIKFN